jgi:hypothetical protein
MMGFVDDEDVERVLLARLGIGRLGVDVAEQALRPNLRQPCHRHDDPWKHEEWVGVEAMCASDIRHQFAVHDGEVEPELVAHLVLPLQRQTWRAHDHGGTGTMAKEQLLDDQASLDRLSQADVIGQQQVRAGCAERPPERLELVGLDVHA